MNTSQRVRMIEQQHKMFIDAKKYEDYRIVKKTLKLLRTKKLEKEKKVETNYSEPEIDGHLMKNNAIDVVNLMAQIETAKKIANIPEEKS